MSFPHAEAVTRGCGTRQEAGVYVECGLSKTGDPLEKFLIDSPELIPAELTITPKGVQLIQREGVWHIVDYVGAENYPNVADFIEEVRRFGLSRKVTPHLNFSLLTPASRILLIHPRAYIENYYLYENWDCKCWGELHEPHRLISQHHDAMLGKRAEPKPCLFVCYEDVEGGTPAEGPTVLDSRATFREMPSFRYLASRRPDHVQPKYKPAFFASFPISGISVVRAGDNSHRDNLDKASRAGVPVEEVDF